MKILFFGLGSIGRRHARILMSGHKHDLYAFRTKKGQLDNDLGIEQVTTQRQIDEIGPDIAFITNPTFLHVKTAISCAKQGMNLFIEKPLSNSMQGIDELIRITRRKGLVTYVGLNLRFHPVLKELEHAIKGKRVLYTHTMVTSYLPNWRKGQDYRKSYSADNAKGGGILLELFHELDYNQWLFGDIKSITGQYGKVSDLELKAEDYADLVLDFKKGFIGTVHMNWFSHHEQRKVLVFCPGQCFQADLVNNRFSKFIKGKLDYDKNPSVERDTTYIQQMRTFLRAVERKDTSINNLDVSKRLLGLLLKFKSRPKNRMRVDR